MAHRIIGYFKDKNEILNKPFYMYLKSEYMWEIEITDITSVEADAKFAIAVINDGNNYKLSFLTDARTSFDITFKGVNKYSSYPSGNTSDPPKDPNSTWTNVVDFGSQTYTITPVSQASQGYPNTATDFPWASITISTYAYADSDGCVRIVDNNGILNDWDTSVSYSSWRTLDAYIREIMGHPAIPPKGQGTVTLDIPANGANLTFTSDLLGVSVTKMISKDAVVDMEDE